MGGSNTPDLGRGPLWSELAGAGDQGAGTRGLLPTWLGKIFIKILCFRSRCRMRSLSSALRATF